MVVEGDLLWEPSESQRSRANITRYLLWLKENKGLEFGSYDELWTWSVADPGTFWGSLREFFGVQVHRPFATVLERRDMPGARWFPGTELNYVEHALRARGGREAVVFRSEDGRTESLSYDELYRRTAAVAAGMRRLGIRRGDRVVAYMPNIPETLVAFLAAASIGAIWSSCTPEFGTRSVVDRFRQIEPKLLLAVDGYRYNGAPYGRREAVAAIQGAIPSLESTVLLPYLDQEGSGRILGGEMAWSDLTEDSAELDIEPVPFDHPLWILYSSGTTGLPKAIVQGHGGILLEHLKTISLHLDVSEPDRFFWYTTTGWMMWNLLIGGLLVGTTIALYDGSPSHPDLLALWRFAKEQGLTHFGTSAPFILACMKAGIEPGQELGLEHLRVVGSTGAPLPPEGFKWIYDHVSSNVLVGSISGGTDACTAFVGTSPTLPVHAGEIQCRALGAKVEAFDEEGRSVTDEVGELVITEPLPSMPLFLWGDPDGRRYRESYFEMFPGVWRHGDWIKVTSRGTCVLYGRSDSTLNRAGVRMGTSEFYRIVEGLPEVLDSLVVDTGSADREGELLLFLVLPDGRDLDEDLKRRIEDTLRREISPRHVPDRILVTPEVPRTLNGKKLEVPVKRILTGTPPEAAVSPDAMSNPTSIRFFVDLRTSL